MNVVDSDSDDEDDEDDDIQSERVEVSFIDVGQGKSVLVDAENGTMLVDAGSQSHSQRPYQDTVKEELVKNNVTTIDDLVITHGHRDHLSYVDELIEDDSIQVNNVYWNQVTNSSGIAEDAEQAILEAEQSGRLAFHRQIDEGDGPGESPDVAVFHGVRDCLIL